MSEGLLNLETLMLQNLNSQTEFVTKTPFTNKKLAQAEIAKAAFVKAKRAATTCAKNRVAEANLAKASISKELLEQLIFRATVDVANTKHGKLSLKG